MTQGKEILKIIQYNSLIKYFYVLLSTTKNNNKMIRYGF